MVYIFLWIFVWGVYGEGRWIPANIMQGCRRGMDATLSMTAGAGSTTGRDDGKRDGLMEKLR